MTRDRLAAIFQTLKAVLHRGRCGGILVDFSGSLADVDLAEAFHQICEKRLTGLLRIRDIRGRTKLIELSDTDAESIGMKWQNGFVAEA